jgi:hypothetical protein
MQSTTQSRLVDASTACGIQYLQFVENVIVRGINAALFPVATSPEIFQQQDGVRPLEDQISDQPFQQGFDVVDIGPVERVARSARIALYSDLSSVLRLDTLEQRDAGVGDLDFSTDRQRCSAAESTLQSQGSLSVKKTGYIRRGYALTLSSHTRQYNHKKGGAQGLLLKATVSTPKN